MRSPETYNMRSNFLAENGVVLRSRHGKIGDKGQLYGEEEGY
jgi:hypothetical protein